MLNLGSKRPSPRGFSYEPRFYDPKEAERRRRTVRIERPPRVKRKTRQPAFIAVGLLLVLALYLYSRMDAVVEGAASLGGLFFGG